MAISLMDEIHSIQPYAVETRRYLHRHPELSRKEYSTALFIESELDKLAIEHRRIGETGVLGTIRGNSDGPVFVLRADIDALPIQEVSGREYGSLSDGVMHACGHDSHTASLLAAAAILSSHRDSFSGEIRLCFQMAEEIGYGAKIFIAEGALEGASRVFGVHTAPDLSVGEVGIRKGLNNASVDHFTIRVKGKASHVSQPELGADALYIASQIVVSLQALVSRLTSPIEPLLIGIGVLRAGCAYNIVAEDAYLEGTVRAVTEKRRAEVRKEIYSVSSSIASMYGGTAECEWEDYASVLINSDEVCDEVMALGSFFKPVADRQIFLSGDDMAEFLKKVPGCYAYVGTRSSKPGTAGPYHRPDFDIDERMLEIATALYVLYPISYLSR